MSDKMEKNKKIIYKKKGNDQDLILKQQGELAWFSFESFSRVPWLVHAYTTRLGGVSRAERYSMNMGFNRGDTDEEVRENYRRLGTAVGFDYKNAVFSFQTHTNNIRLVTEEDKGKGIVRERDYTDIDGLVTDRPGIPLVCFSADCVLMTMADLKNKAVGVFHAGWRGTLLRMGECGLKAMKDSFGTKAEDVIAGIGPSICGECFEVGPEVAEAFSEVFSPEEMKILHKPGAGEKSYLDLWEANRLILQSAGIPLQNIHITNACTRCNPHLFYSHRLMGKERGTLAAVIVIRE